MTDDKKYELIQRHALESNPNFLYISNVNPSEQNPDLKI